MHFCTGPDERKSKNLAENQHCVLTTGQNILDGLDLVLEGTAEAVGDRAQLEHVAASYESKYGLHFSSPDGTWSGLADAIRRGDVPVYRVTPVTVFGFGKGVVYSQTRWTFT
jgi:hypothetical protein